MKGDFTRNTFDPGKHFTRVLMQQGRVQLDADWNEQAAILLHYLRALAADLIGPYGGRGDSFKIEKRSDNDGNDIKYDFWIHSGHYYVNGILCENKNGFAYTNQPYYPLEENQVLATGSYLVYLDAWERHITAIEDPSIREVALGGPDTATRAQIVWQVKTRLENDVYCGNLPWDDLVEKWQSKNRGQLKARAKISEDSDLTDPCITPPEARYRGAENQLYRVEIHRGGIAAVGVTFKWSRENGSVVFPIRKIETDGTAGTTTVTLEHLGRDDNRFGLKEGNWVEIVNDDYILKNHAEPLLQVNSINRVDMEVTLHGLSGIVADSAKHPLLRRWDHKAGDPAKHGSELADGWALLLEEDKWLNLEDGVQICFQSISTDNGNEKHFYRTGDYWLIPARTATGDVEWPQEESEEGKMVPKALSPHGVEHHYAPLAIISVKSDGTVEIPDDVDNDCRSQFKSLVVLS